MLYVKPDVPEEVLRNKYGFTKKYGLEYYHEEGDSCTVLHRVHRGISCFIPMDCEDGDIPVGKVVYRLIVDGLVEKGKSKGKGKRKGKREEKEDAW